MPTPLTALNLEDLSSVDPIQSALDMHLGHVRSSLEQLTNGDPRTVGMIPWEMWALISDWVKHEPSLDVIDRVLQQRLKLGPPYEQKALILLQLLPEDRLGAYVPLLDPLLPASPSESETNSPPAYPACLPSPHMHHQLSTLHTKAVGQAASAKKAQGTAQAKADEAKRADDWALWSSLYGKTCQSGWRPLPAPDEVRMGYWDSSEINAEDWWGGVNGDLQ
ncbi:hypothetical protein IAU60_001233 [Kwoniella sp. DSM 27419]